MTWEFDEENSGKVHDEVWGLIHEETGYEVGVYVAKSVKRDPFEGLRLPIDANADSYKMARELARNVAKLPALLESNTTIPHLLEVERGHKQRVVKGSEVTGEVVGQAIPYHQEGRWFMIEQGPGGQLLLKHCKMVNGKNVPPNERTFVSCNELKPSASMFLYNAAGVFFEPNVEEKE